MPQLLEEARLSSNAAPDISAPALRFPAEAPSLRDRQVLVDYSLQLIKVGLPLMLADMLAVTLSLSVGWAAVLALGKEVNHFSAFATCSVLAFSLSFWANGLYPSVGLHPAIELRKLFRAAMAVSLALCGGLLVVSSLQSPYLWSVILAMPVELLLLPPVRSLTKGLMRKFELGVPLYFLGDRQKVFQVYRDMSRFGWTMLRPVGRFEPLPTDDRSESRELVESNEELAFERKVQYMGTPEDLCAEAQSKGVYWLCVVDAAMCSDLADARGLLQFFPEVIWIQARNASSAAAASVIHCGLASGVRVEEALILPGAKLQKRALDIVVSAGLLFVLLPLILLIALLVKASSRGPVFYCHRRIGRGGRNFNAWKFRSMVCSADKILAAYLKQHPELTREWEQNHKLKDDPRVTWVGQLLRKTSLDELPQLWNVLRGEMSLVGPRPIVEEEIAKYGPTFRYYLRVTPGITGLWQISGRNNTTYRERLALDEYYVCNWSPWLDFYILLRTVKTVMLCEGAY